MAVAQSHPLAAYTLHCERPAPGISEESVYATRSDQHNRQNEHRDVLIWSCRGTSRGHEMKLETITLILQRHQSDCHTLLSIGATRATFSCGKNWV
jgi:hypothetical protein